MVLFVGVSLLCSIACSGEHHSPNDDLRLWYDEAATIWEEYLPLGNGRMGMMMSGGVASDHIILNKGTMWAGQVQYTDNPEAAHWLPKIREALLRGDNREAEIMMYRYFTCSGRSSASPEYGSYSMFADLHIDHMGAESLTIDDYRRELSLADAVARTVYCCDGAEYVREYFCSMADDVAVVHLTAECAVDYRLSLSHPMGMDIRAKDNELSIMGMLPSGSECEGVKFYGRLRVLCDGEVDVDGNDLIVRGANDVVVLISAGTNYANEDYIGRVDRALDLSKSYAELRRDHIAHHRELFDRVVINLGEQPADIPTDERLMRYAEGEDDAPLAALYAQYGRYLLIASAYNAVLPPNLQGIWANTIWCPWNGDRLDYLVAMSTKSINGAKLTKELMGEEECRQGDQINTLIRTVRGRTIDMQHNVMTPRPYSRMYQLVGTEGFANKYPIEGYTFKLDQIRNVATDEDAMPDIEALDHHTFAPADVVAEMTLKYRHPVQLQPVDGVPLQEYSLGIGGHGGMDFMMDYRLVYCLRHGLPLDMDVYDAAEWSSMGELTRISIENGSKPVRVPDFTRGDWDKVDGLTFYFAD